MTDSTGPGPGLLGKARAPVRAMAAAALRALGTTAALVARYYLLPLDHTSSWVAATILIIGLAAFIALMISQARWIIRSRFPGLRANEALATSLPLFLLLLSGTYVAMAAVSASNFGEKLSNTDALYFAVTRVQHGAELPRIICGEHGKITAMVPWARHDNRFSRARAE